MFWIQKEYTTCSYHQTFHQVVLPYCSVRTALQFRFTRVLLLTGKKNIPHWEKKLRTTPVSRSSQPCLQLAIFTAEGHDHTLTKVWVQLHRKYSGSLFSQETWPVTCWKATACQRLVEHKPKDKSLADHILKDDSLVGLAFVSKKCWWMCLWVGSKELNCWWIPSEGTDVRKEAQYSLHLTKQQISLWQRKTDMPGLNLNLDEHSKPILETGSFLGTLYFIYCIT